MSNKSKHYIATIHVRIYNAETDKEAIRQAKEIEQDLTLRTGGATLDAIEKHIFGELDNQVIWGVNRN